MSGLNNAAFTNTVLLSGLALSLISGLNDSVSAQLIPDQTLPGKTSVVQQSKEGKRILGGSRRGQNLFHSFRDFNVGTNQSVYFANPAAINNILTRVTGQNPSQILGKLGVEGPASLFLVNPHGIVFGPNASLDIPGSFFATTAERIPLGKMGFFDAVNPQANPLLAIAPEANFTQFLTPRSGSIQNQARLSVGKELNLSGQNLNLQGQLISGENLTLQARQNLSIRDSQDQPFIAAAGQDLTLLGNTIDIVALIHPDSVLFSQKNTRLISPQPLNGDAHFLTGGSFIIQTPQGSGGVLDSQLDPVIRSVGDVAFSGYIGRSLHIIAGGTVEIPDGIIITGEDVIGGIQEEIILSDGTPLEIDGAREPTLDIRAGVNPEHVGDISFDPIQFFPFSFDNFILNPGLFDTTPDLSPAATSANIRIGPIDFRDTSDPTQQTRTFGQIFLSNQYHPNRTLPGNITLTSESFADSPMTLPIQGVNYTLDSRSTLDIERNLDAAGLRGGQIKLLAQDDITLAPDIQISTFGGEISGPIDINTPQQLTLQPGSQLISAGNFFGSSGQQGGQIQIRADALKLLDGARIQSDTAGFVQAGNIDITAKDIFISGANITPDTTTSAGIFAQVLAPPPGFDVARGNGGNIQVKGDRLIIEGGAQISTTTFSAGDAGTIDIDVDEIQLMGDISGTQVASGIFAQASQNATGAGGAITINSDRLKVLEGATILTDTSSPKPAGDISIETQSLVLKGRSRTDNPSIISASSSSFSPAGEAGNINITAQTVEIAEGALVSLLTTGQAAAGQFDLRAQSLRLQDGGVIAGVGQNASGSSRSLNFAVDQILITDGGRISNSTQGSGNAGPIEFHVDRFVIWENSSVIATSEGSGNAGEINVRDAELVEVKNSSILTTVAENAPGQGGPIQIETDRLQVTQGGQISASTSGAGLAGDLQIHATQSIVLDGVSQNNFPSGLFANVQPEGTAQGGDIRLNTATLRISNGAGVAANSLGNGAPGNIIINAEDIQLQGRSDIRPSQITANVRLPNAEITGGNITLNTGTLSYGDGALITSGSEGIGDAGQVEIIALGAIAAENGKILTSATQGAGGRVTITADTIRLRGDSDIRTDVANGTNGGGDINLTARSIIAFDDSDILAFSRDGRGGNIRLETPVFFGENRQAVRDAAITLDQLDGNQRVDLNATGAIQSGVIEIPDVSFIESNLSDLPDTLISTNQVLANSCVARGRRGQGTFILTGAGGLPPRPGQGLVPTFPMGEIQAADEQEQNLEPRQNWQPGDPIEEPDGVYQLENGDRLLWIGCRR